MNLLNNIIFAIVYTVGYVFLALLSTGGGHGNFITLYLIPTWIFNFVALFLLARLKNRFTKILFVVLMATYYLLNITILINGFYDKEEKIYTSSLVVPIIWFVAGQLVLWSVFLREIANTQPNNSSED